MKKLPIYLLENGIKIILDEVKSVDTIAVGFFFNVGSINDGVDKDGLAHFCEHILFKNQFDNHGEDLIESLDKRGILVNAFTAKELTCFNFRGFSQDANFILKTFKRVLLNQYFTEENLEIERQIILKELMEGKNSSEIYFDELLLKTAYKNQPLSHSVIGDEKSIKNINKEDIIKFIKNNYSSDMVICLSGNFNKNKILDVLNNLFSDIKKINKKQLNKSSYQGGEKIIKDNGDVSYLYVGYDAPNYNDIKKVYITKLLKIALSGTLNSILYKELREKRGLVYQIKTSYFYYSNNGLLSIFLPVAKGKTQEVKKILFDILSNIKITDEELKIMKTLMKVGISIEMENMQSRILRSGYQVMLYKNLYSVKEISNLIDSITVKDIELLSKDMFSKKKTLIIFGD